MRDEVYIKRLQKVISQLHGCDSKHIDSVAVEEVYQGKIAWQGFVEVFRLKGHPKAKRAYGWSHVDGANDDGERFITVLGLPPVTSAEIAVKIAIASEVRTAQRKQAEKN